MEQIILAVLEDHDGLCLDNGEERKHLARQVANELTHQTLQQVAMLTGGELVHDNDGQAIIYTGIQNPDYDRNCMQHTDPFNLV